MALFDLGFNSKEKIHEDLQRIIYMEEHGLHASYTGIKALKNSDVFTAVSVIASDIASTKLLTEGYERHELFEEVLNLFNKNPHDDLTGWHFKFIIIANMLLNGEAYVEIVRDKNGVPTMLHFLHNELVSIEEDSNTHEILYNLTQDYEGNNVKVTSEDILHFRYMTLDGFKGYSPLYALVNEIGISQGSKGFLKNFFNNGGTSTNILTLKDSALSQEERDEISDSFAKSMARNNGGLITLDDTMDFNRIQIPTEALNFLNSYKFSTQQVAKAFGLPLSKLGIETVNTSVTQANIEYLQSTLHPLFSMMIAELDLKIFRHINPNVVVKPDVSRLIDSDPEVKLERISRLVKDSIIDINEARAAFNYEPIEHGENVLVDLNKIPLSALDEYQRDKIKGEINNTLQGGDEYDEQ